MSEFGFDLQLFADSSAGGDEVNNSSKNEPVDENKPTDSDSNDESKKNELETQRRIDEALASAKVKWEKDYKRKAEAAKKEAMAQAICAVADGLWLTIDREHVHTRCIQKS